MSWYKKIVLAQGVEQYLATLGADEDIIEYILSQGVNTQPLVNEFRKNPEMDRTQLELFQLPQKKEEEIDPYLLRERQRATTISDDDNFKQWVLVAYRKIRKGKLPPEGDINRLNEVLTIEEQNEYLVFDEIVDEIVDWYDAILPEIASYSMEQAMAASNEWHRVAIGKGAGLIYESTNEGLIIYGPEWENHPEWKGWTIQNVTSENDLKVEGYLMHHCVGNSYDQIASEEIMIYSLRDPSNKPYVTIETDASGDIVKQIQGFSNNTPDEEYREMIANWISNDKFSPTQWQEYRENTFEIDGSLDQIAYSLNDLEHGDINDGYDEGDDGSYFAFEYGLSLPIDEEFEKWKNNFNVDEIMDKIFEAMQWEYPKEDPNIINWYDEGIVDSLIKVVDTYDRDQYDGKNDKHYYSHILRDILKEKINDIERFQSIRPLTEYDKSLYHDEMVHASFAKHVLQQMGMPEGQLTFDFSHNKNWYGKIVLASGVEQFLATLGADEEIIQYILSQGDNMQYYVNEFKKNPGMSREQLEAFQFPQKKNLAFPLPIEKNIAKNFELELPQFSKWLLDNLYKLRKGLYDEDNLGRMSYPSDHPDLTPYDHDRYSTLMEKVGEIRDWIRTTQLDIMSFVPEQAIEATEEWHRIIAGKGSGVEYEPTRPERIMYGPKWSNPKWEGWTIQKVDSENDLTAEGGTKRMNHCINSYWGDVEREVSVVYSLRDPKNEPHVTLDIAGPQAFSAGTIKQIKGRSNSEPKEEYKAMIKEWISTKGEEVGIVKEINTFEELKDDHQYEEINVSDIANTIDRILQGDSNEYGLKYIFDSTIDSVIDMLVTSGEVENSGFSNTLQEYRGDIAEVSSYITNLALMQDLNLSHWPRDAGEWAEFRKSPKESDWEHIQEVEKIAFKFIDEISEELIHGETGLEYPQEEDYENPDEFEKALEGHDADEADIHGEWMSDTIKGGFAQDLLKEIEDFRKNGWVPSAQELFNIKKRKEEENLRRGEEGQQMLQNDINRRGSNNWYKKAVVK